MVDLAGLNAPQREAVLHERGPLVVFAGAGSGKTRVITQRIAHLLENGRVRPWRIMAVTFTNKAAQEMRERLARMVPDVAQDVQVGTFHATTAKLLRRHADEFGVKRDFVIYDDGDSQALIKRVLEELQLNPKELPPKKLAHAIEKAKQEMQSPADVPQNDPWTRIVARVYERYEERLQMASALDFGDLIYRFVRALEKNDALRHTLAERYEHLLVDEFQDTNHSQLRLVRALASVHRNIVVVGDDDQSIYRWRGADRRNILDFRRHYPDATTIKLEQNYRSTARILRVAHAVIAPNLDREPKELWTENDDGDRVVVVRSADERDEAAMIVQGAKSLTTIGVPFSEIAVFYRTHAQSRVIEEAARVANVPYRIVGGLKFYDRAEVKDLLSYLRVLQNPDDDISLLRILNVPTRGIGKTSETRLVDEAAARGSSVWQALVSVTEGSRGKLSDFRELILELRQFAERELPSDTARKVLEQTGYLQKLKQEDSAEADARIENIEELIGSILHYESQTNEASLSGFLESVTLDTTTPEEQGAALTLMTVHAAKGLEFDAVFVSGLEEQMFPMRGTDLGEDPEELEEERRLAYVAFTRARKRLFLSYATRRMIFGQTRFGDASRFLFDLPPADIERVGTGNEDYDERPRRSMDWDNDYGEARSYSSRPTTSSYRPPSKVETPRRSSTESYVDYSDGDGVTLRPGSRVRHVRFGVGEVRKVEAGSPAKVHVIFPGWGAKTLAAQFLEPA